MRIFWNDWIFHSYFALLAIMKYLVESLLITVRQLLTYSKTTRQNSKQFGRNIHWVTYKNNFNEFDLSENTPTKRSDGESLVERENNLCRQVGILRS